MRYVNKFVLFHEVWESLRASKLKNGSCDTDHTPLGVVCHL